MRLKDKVALITGAGSGIGRETARLFAEAGATVVVADFKESEGRETATLLGDADLFVKVDVSRWDDTQRMVDQTVQRFGRLDILYNNAGIFLSNSPVHEVAESEWDKTLAVNLRGVFLGCRHALPVMMAQRSGVIINTASRAGLAAGPRMAAYVASKGGVVSLTRHLALEYGRYNIRVNCICPGAMDKPMGAPQSWLTQPRPALDELRLRLLAGIPLGRFIPEVDIAYAALYLASDEAANVTGTALVVDGGNLTE